MHLGASHWRSTSVRHGTDHRKGDGRETFSRPIGRPDARLSGAPRKVRRGRAPTSRRHSARERDGHRRLSRRGVAGIRPPKSAVSRTRRHRIGCAHGRIRCASRVVSSLRDDGRGRSNRSRARLGRGRRGGRRRRHGCRRRRGSRVYGGRRRSRQGRRSWARSGARRRSRRRKRRRTRGPRRKQRCRIDVFLVSAGADAEVHVGSCVLRLARRARLCDDIAFGHVRAAPDRDRTDVRERRLEAVGRRDRDRQAVRGHLAGKRHLTGYRGSNDVCSADRDVDATMLARGVLVVTDRELTKHGAVDRPCPGMRGRGVGKRDHRKRERGDRERCCPRSEHGSRLARAATECQRE